jgi:hypothetical protein
MPIQFFAESRGLKPKQVGLALERAAEKILNPPLETAISLSYLPAKGFEYSIVAYGFAPILAVHGRGARSMTPEERRILSPLARQLRLDYPEDWWSLKYQTQNGPELCEFPNHPAALEFQKPAQRAIAELDGVQKSVLLAQWRSKPRYPYDFTDDQRILRQYEVILVDILVKRARQAGARTSEF